MDDLMKKMNEPFVYPKKTEPIWEGYRALGWPVKKIFMSTTAPEALDWTCQLISVVGASHSGKTHWLKSLIKSIIPFFDYIGTFSFTDKITTEYLYIPSENRFSDWEDNPETGKKGFRSILKVILATQAEVIESNGPQGAPNILVILDDPMGVVDFHNSAEFKQIAGHVRKYKITIFIIHQYVKSISPALRNGFHKLVVFTNNEDDQKAIKRLVIGFPNISSWTGFITKATDDYGCVIYNRMDRTFHCAKAPKELKDYRIKFNYIKLG